MGAAGWLLLLLHMRRGLFSLIRAWMHETAACDCRHGAGKLCTDEMDDQLCNQTCNECG